MTLTQILIIVGAHAAVIAIMIPLMHYATIFFNEHDMCKILKL